MQAAASPEDIQSLCSNLLRHLVIPRDGVIPNLDSDNALVLFSRIFVHFLNSQHVLSDFPASQEILSRLRNLLKITSLPSISKKELNDILEHLYKSTDGESIIIPFASHNCAVLVVNRKNSQAATCQAADSPSSSDTYSPLYSPPDQDCFDFFLAVGYPCLSQDLKPGTLLRISSPSIDWRVPIKDVLESDEFMIQLQSMIHSDSETLATAGNRFWAPLREQRIPSEDPSMDPYAKSPSAIVSLLFPCLGAASINGFEAIFKRINTNWHGMRQARSGAWNILRQLIHLFFRINYSRQSDVIYKRIIVEFILFVLENAKEPVKDLFHPKEALALITKKIKKMKDLLANSGTLDLPASFEEKFFSSVQKRVSFFSERLDGMWEKECKRFEQDSDISDSIDHFAKFGPSKDSDLFNQSTKFSTADVEAYLKTEKATPTARGSYILNPCWNLIEFDDQKPLSDYLDWFKDNIKPKHPEVTVDMILQHMESFMYWISNDQVMDEYVLSNERAAENHYILMELMELYCNQFSELFLNIEQGQKQLYFPRLSCWVLVLHLFVVAIERVVTKYHDPFDILKSRPTSFFSNMKVLESIHLKTSEQFKALCYLEQYVDSKGSSPFQKGFFSTSHEGIPFKWASKSTAIQKDEERVRREDQVNEEMKFKEWDEKVETCKALAIQLQSLGCRCETHLSCEYCDIKRKISSIKFIQIYEKKLVTDNTEAKVVMFCTNLSSAPKQGLLPDLSVLYGAYQLLFRQSHRKLNGENSSIMIYPHLLCWRLNVISLGSTTKQNLLPKIDVISSGSLQKKSSVIDCRSNVVFGLGKHPISEYTSILESLLRQELALLEHQRKYDWIFKVDPQNEMIALSRSHVDCPSAVMKESEFLSLCTIRSGGYIQLMQILRLFANDNLSMCWMSEFPLEQLILFALHQVGPRTKSKERLVYPIHLREWKTDIFNPSFCNNLSNVLEKRLEQAVVDYRNFGSLRMFTSILTFMVNNCTDSECDLFIKLIHRLVDLLASQIRTVSSTRGLRSPATDIYSVLQNLSMIGIQCFDISDPNRRSLVLTDHQLSSLVLFSITLFKYPQIGQEPTRYSNWIATTRIIRLSLMPIIASILDQPKNSLLDAIRAHTPTKISDGGVWKREKACVLHLAGNIHHIEFNFITGEFKIDGNPPAGLPDLVLNDSTFVSLFRGVQLNPQPRGVDKFDMEIEDLKFSELFSVSYQIFLDRKGPSVSIQETRSSTQNPGIKQTILQLIPRTRLPGAELPLKMIEDYSHWYYEDEQNRQILFRPRHFHDTGFLDDSYIEFIWDMNSCQIKKLQEGESNGDQFFLVTRTSQAFTKTAPVFDRLDSDCYIHLWTICNRDKVSLEAELPRHQLTFVPTEDCSSIACVQHPNLKVCSHQEQGIFVGLKSGIWMESCGPDQTKQLTLLIANAPLSRQNQSGFHFATTSQFAELDKTSYFMLDKFDSIGFMSVSSAEAALFVAALHAFTAGPLPEPFTGMLGHESAIEWLHRYESNMPLTESELRYLSMIVRIQPKFSSTGIAGNVDRAYGANFSESLLVIINKIVTVRSEMLQLWPSDAYQPVKQEDYQINECLKSFYQAHCFKYSNQVQVDIIYTNPEEVAVLPPKMVEYGNIVNRLCALSRRGIWILDSKSSLQTLCLDLLPHHGPINLALESKNNFDELESMFSASSAFDRWMSLYQLIIKSEFKKLDPFLLGYICWRGISKGNPYSSLLQIVALAKLRSSGMFTSRPDIPKILHNGDRLFPNGDYQAYSRYEVDHFVDSHTKDRSDLRHNDPDLRHPEWADRKNINMKAIHDEFFKGLDSDGYQGRDPVHTKSQIASLYLINFRFPKDMTKAFENWSYLYSNRVANDQFNMFIAQLNSLIDVCKKSMAEDVTKERQMEFEAIDKSTPMEQIAVSPNTKIQIRPTNSNQALFKWFEEYYKNEELLEIANELVETGRHEDIEFKLASILKPKPKSQTQTYEDLDQEFPFDSNVTHSRPLGKKSFEHLKASWNADIDRISDPNHHFEFNLARNYAKILDECLDMATKARDQLYSKITLGFDDSSMDNLSIYRMQLASGLIPQKCKFSVAASVVRDSPPFYKNDDLSEDLKQRIEEFQTYQQTLKLAWIIMNIYVQKITSCIREITNTKYKPSDALNHVIPLVKELHTQHATGFEVSNYPEWLIIELENKMIRSQQVDLALKMMGQSKACNSFDQGVPISGKFVQLGMGEGKTSVILPIICATLSSSILPRVVAIDSQLATMTANMRLKLGGLLQRPVYCFPFHRQQTVHSNLLSKHKECKEKRGIIVCSREQVLSFSLKAKEATASRVPLVKQDDKFVFGTELTPSSMSQMIPLLQEVFSYWRDHVMNILDESDEILKEKDQLHYPIGNQMSVVGGPRRWIVSQNILHLVQQVAEKFSKSINRDKILVEYTSLVDEQRQRTHTQLRGSWAHFQISKCCLSDFRKEIAKSIIYSNASDVEWKTDKIRALSEEERDQVFQILAHPEAEFDVDSLSKNILDALEYAFSINKHEKWTDLLIIRGLLSYDVLGEVLCSRWSVDYGVRHPNKPDQSDFLESLSSNKMNEKISVDQIRSAVPYRAKDTASERAEFQHDDVRILKTLISHYKMGLQYRDFFEAIIQLNKMRDLSEKSRIYTSWITLYMADEELDQVIPDALKTRLLVDKVEAIDTSNPQQMESLYQVFRFNRNTINFWLNSLIFPTETRQFPMKISCSASDLVYTQPSIGSCGFSGTNSNRDTFPTNCLQEDSPQLLHITAMITKKIFYSERLFMQRQQSLASSEVSNISIPILRQLPPNVSGNSILDELLGPEMQNRFELLKDFKLQVLIDSGALLVGCQMTNLNVSKYILTLLNVERFSGVIFFDEQNRLSALDRKGHVRDFMLSPFQKDLRRAFVYLDDYHTRGTDLKLPPNAHAIMTIGQGMDMDKFLQACLRMRQLGAGQTISFVAAHQVYSNIQDLSSSKTLSVEDIIGWTHLNGVEAIERSLPNWANQCFEHIKNHILDYCIHGSDFKSVQELSPTLYTSLFTHFENHDLFYMYARKRVEEDGAIVIVDFLNSQIEHLKDILRNDPFLLERPDFQTKALSMVDVLSKPILQRVENFLKGRMLLWSGAGGTDSEQERELHRQQEQEEEVEKEKAAPRKVLKPLFSQLLILLAAETLSSQNEYENRLDDETVSISYSLRRSTCEEDMAHLGWDPRIRVTKGCLQSLEAEVNSPFEDRFRYPSVAMILFDDKPSTGSAPFSSSTTDSYRPMKQLFLISNYEADNIKLILDNKLPAKIGLCLIAPRCSKFQTNLLLMKPHYCHMDYMEYFNSDDWKQIATQISFFAGSTHYEPTRTSSDEYLEDDLRWQLQVFLGMWPMPDLREDQQSNEWKKLAELNLIDQTGFVNKEVIVFSSQPPITPSRWAMVCRLARLTKTTKSPASLISKLIELRKMPLNNTELEKYQ